MGSAEAQVADLIEREVREGRLGPGARLPTERQLAERASASRTAVRRALAMLEAQGRIVRHVGRGTFLAPVRPDPAGPLPVPSTSPAEIMAVRLLIEPQTMPLAATAATPEDFAEMERCLRGGEEHQQQEEFEHWDVAFHRALAVATHNTLLIQIYDIVNDARHHPLWGRLKQRSFTSARCGEYIRDHRDIYEALLDRDGAAAHAAMRTHVLRVQSNIFDVHL
ncbi:MAG TPA: FadR/GntR family transcriptional regulator [Pseudonocardia sp.]|nr:FadR/GntR family transcriptional regulator [Pseudonocardia sp.]